MLMHRMDRAPSLGMIVLDEDLDEQTVHRLLAEAGQAVDEGVVAIILDCAQLRFLTPYGLSSLLRVRKLLKARFGSGQGRLRLVSIRPSVLETIQSAELSDAFGIYPNVGAAVSDPVPGEEPVAPPLLLRTSGPQPLAPLSTPLPR